MLEGIAQMTEDRSDLAGKKRAVDLIVNIADDVPETAMLDETFFMRICMNLLSNALKFTERGLIMIDVETNDDDMLTLRVKDTGIGPSLSFSLFFFWLHFFQHILTSFDILAYSNLPGVPPNFMSSLFEPYRQADSSTTRPHQGTGLGKWENIHVSQVFNVQLTLLSSLI
jgi:signal transduction histidine kinase